MIRITETAFQKRALGGTLVLNRAAVVVLGIDLREGRSGSPGMRCDVAYGVEAADGSFQAFNYDSAEHCIPRYIEPPQWPAAIARDMPSLPSLGVPPPIGTNGAQKGSDLAEMLALWMEAALVAQGVFGPGAELARRRPGSLGND